MQDSLRLFERKTEDEFVEWDVKFRKKYCQEVKPRAYLGSGNYSGDYLTKSERSKRLMGLRSLIEDGFPEDKESQAELLEQICHEIREIDHALYKAKIPLDTYHRGANLHWVYCALNDAASRIRGENLQQVQKKMNAIALPSHLPPISHR